MYKITGTELKRWIKTVEKLNNSLVILRQKDYYLKNRAEKTIKEINNYINPK